MISSFSEIYNEDPSSLLEIGKGGSGTVYVNPENPNLVFKVSSVQNQCRVWNKEYQFYEEFSKPRDLVISTPLVEIIELYEYSTFVSASGKEGCIMALQRVHPLFENTHSRSIHALFGTETSNTLHMSRGYFYGFKELSEYLENIKEYIHQLGEMMAYIHYVIKNDAYDVEVIVGYDEYRNFPKLFIIDFDLSQMIEEYNKKTITRMVEALTFVPYFPMPEDKNYKDFKKGYMKVAELVGMSEIAIEVLEKYEDLMERVSIFG